MPNQTGVVFVGGSDQLGPVPVPAPFVNGGNGVIVGPGVGKAVPVPADVAPFGIVRDGFWPRSVASWLVLSVVFLLLSVQFVSPTRRWRMRRGRRTREVAP